MEQGDAFAAQAALGALVALIGVGAFGVAYGWTALRFGWAPSVLAGWGAFLLVTLLSQAVHWTPLLAIVCTLASFALTVRLLPPARGRHAPAVVRMAHGFYPAMWGMGLFCCVVALVLVPLGPWLGFLAALAVQMVVHGLVLWRMIRTRGAVLS